MRQLIGILLTLFFCLSFFGCAGKGKLTHEETCNKKFERLHTKYLNGKYSLIRENLAELLSTCSGSGFIEQALFELAESHYNLKEWIEARAEYTNLLRDFPQSPFAEKAHYRKAECSMNLVLAIDRDQSQTNEAIEDFQSFFSNFPKSVLADSAKEQIRKLKKRKADKDLHIAGLYLKMDEYQAAAIYLKGVLDNFPEYNDKRQVQMHLIECYISMAQIEEAEKYLKILESPVQEESDKNQIEKLKKLIKQKRSELETRYELKNPDNTVQQDL